MIMQSNDEIKNEIPQWEVDKYVYEAQKYARDRIAAIKFRGLIADAFEDIERHGEGPSVTDIVMNVATYRRFSDMRDMVDRIHNGVSRRLVAAGLLATIWGARIWINARCIENEMKFYGNDGPQLMADFPEIAEAMGIVEDDIQAIAGGLTIEHDVQEQNVDECPQFKKHELLANQ